MQHQKLIFSFLFLFMIGISGAYAYSSEKTDENCCPETEYTATDRSNLLGNPIKPISARRPLSVTSANAPDALVVPGDFAGGFQSVADMIAGRVAGVQVSGSFNNYRIRIRGSMRPPLLVVDDFPFYNLGDDQAFNAALQMIPAAEVKSIEVYKNIGKTIIYGGQGANGVIVVKTRGATMDN